MLRYRPSVSVGDLDENECTIRGAQNRELKRWWQLWFYVRTTLGTLQHIAVPVAPGGVYTEHGPSGRRTWGLKKVGPGNWQVSPSINATYTKTVNGKEVEAELWHQTPLITGVPEGEAWTTQPVPT